jgi:hypothetical protein
LSGDLDLDYGSAELTHQPAENMLLPILDSPKATSELADCRRVPHMLRSQPAAWGQTEGFRMGVAGWRFAHMKRNVGRREAIVAVLEEWPGVCSVVVAASSMIMIGIMLYNDWPQ